MQIHARLNWINMTPQEGHFTFGYYDRCTWDADDRLHLAMKFGQQDRLPSPGEKGTVGVIDRETLEFRPLAETEAWGHQVGCLNLWRESEPGMILYNDFVRDTEGWRPVVRRHHIDAGPAGEYDGHLYSVSGDGKYASSINYGRIPRRGYSFAHAELPEDEWLPDVEKEGFFLIDLQSGERRLIASYRQMMDIHPRPYDLEGRYFWLNQGTFNSDNTRVMVLFRYCPNLGTEHAAVWPWCTDLYTVATDGSDLRCALPHPYWRGGGISHQIWGRTPGEILVDANWCERGNQYIVFEEDRRPIKGTKISDGQGPQGHLNFSPDGKWMAADTYPDADSIQHLALVKVETGEWKQIGAFRHESEAAKANKDLRCDLHPRWSHDSRTLTVDTIHDGPRKIYMLDIEEAAAELF